MLIDDTRQRQIGGDRPMVLDTEEAGVIVKGRVDVFAVPLHRDGGAGQRPQTCGLEPGSASFGSPLSDDRGLRRLAVGTSGTQLRRLATEPGDEWKASRESTAECVALLETWV